MAAIHHHWLDVVTRIDTVFKVFEARDRKRLDHLGLGYQVLDKFTAGDFILKAVS